VVVFPRVTEEFGLLIKLSVDIIPKVLQSLLKFILKSIQCSPDLRHALLGLFAVLLDFADIGYLTICLTCMCWRSAVQVDVCFRFWRSSCLRNLKTCLSFDFWGSPGSGCLSF